MEDWSIGKYQKLEYRRNFLPISTDKIFIDREIYPRDYVDDSIVLKYAKAMKSGSQFPEPIVAEDNQDYILIDEKHRVDAYKKNRQKYIWCEVKLGLSKKQIFIESVRRNIGHGKSFEAKEVKNITLTLQAWKLSNKEIEKIIRIPANEIKREVAMKLDSPLIKQVVEIISDDKVPELPKNFYVKKELKSGKSKLFKKCIVCLGSISKSKPYNIYCSKGCGKIYTRIYNFIVYSQKKGL